MGMIALSTDDTAFAGERRRLEQQLDGLRKVFVSGEIECNRFTYLNKDYGRQADGSATMTQRQYSAGISHISLTRAAQQDPYRALTPEEITALQVGLGRNVALYYLPFIGFFLSGSIPDLLGYSMPQFLKRPCD